MKRVLLLLAVLSAPVAANPDPSPQQMDEFCKIIAQFAANVAVARDRGVPEDEAQKVTEGGSNPQTNAMLGKIIPEVYRSFLPPAMTYASYYKGCSSEPATDQAQTHL